MHNNVSAWLPSLPSWECPYCYSVRKELKSFNKYYRSLLYKELKNKSIEMIFDEDGKPTKKYDEKLVDLPFMMIYIYSYGFRSLAKMIVQYYSLTMIFKFLNTS